MLRVNYSRDGLIFSDFEVRKEIRKIYELNKGAIFSEEVDVEVNLATERGVMELFNLLQDNANFEKYLVLMLEGKPWSYDKYAGPDAVSLDSGWYSDVVQESINKGYECGKKEGVFE